MLRRGIAIAVLSLVPVAALVYAQVAPKPATAPATPPKPGSAPVMMPAPPPAKPSAFDEIDTNHDGFISRDEFLAAQKKRFAEFDTNHDGKIDAKEIASSPPLMERNLKMAERMVKNWDANGDGVVSADEFKQFSEQQFAKQDKEGTGKIARPKPPMMAGAPGAPGAKPIQSSPVQLNVKPAPQPTPPKSDPQH
jgi:hypothetical protein